MKWMTERIGDAIKFQNLKFRYLYARKKAPNTLRLNGDIERMLSKMPGSRLSRKSKLNMIADVMEYEAKVIRAIASQIPGHITLAEVSITCEDDGWGRPIASWPIDS